MAQETLLKRNMRLFGLPYQFNDSVDPRMPTFSDSVGRKFAENIILDAPVISIIPGKPKYLAGAEDTHKSITNALVLAASDNLEPIKEKIRNDTKREFRYYDFERAYTEYMKYVNILCRSCAAFLEINETIDGESCQQYDYRKYRWTTDSIHGSNFIDRSITSVGTTVKQMIGSVVDNIKISFSDTSTNTSSKELKYVDEFGDTDGDSSSIEDLFTSYNFVQFFIDSDISYSESMSNEHSESMIKSAIINNAQNIFKELSFISSSVGMEGLQSFLTDSADSLTNALGSAFGGTSSQFTRALGDIINISGNLVQGENIIMPNVYQSSSYSKSYTFTVHLKTPYGTKFGYFMDICVPLMHLIALGIPKQTTSNTYGSPFLVKAYCEGVFTCNMGIVQNISITRGINSAFSADGLPTEVDVSVTIDDLYSDLSMSPQNAPILFAHNSSLIEYLATTCGLSLITPNVKQRVNMIVNTVANSFADIGNNIINGITEATDNLLKDFFHLNW